MERFDRSIKRIAARKRCTIEEVYWYNVTPKDGIHSITALANVVYLYEVRMRGVDKIAPMPPGFKHETDKEGDVPVGTQYN